MAINAESESDDDEGEYSGEGGEKDGTSTNKSVQPLNFNDANK